MLERIRNPIFSKALQMALLASGALLGACATKEKPPLVADPSAGRESTLPWNEQQSWENRGQLGQMADRMGGNSR
jgi:outer membrane biogenesis lipoprotein LolB